LSVNVEEEAARNIYNYKLRDQIHKVLDSVLDKRQARIIKMRFLKERDGGRDMKKGRSNTLDKVGAEEGVTRERIRQIENKTLEKLHQSEELRNLWSVYGTKDNKIPLVSLEGRNPEQILFSEKRINNLVDPLVTSVFDLQPLPARIAYRNLFAGLSPREIALELKLDEGMVTDLLYHTRIDLWEMLPMQEFNKSLEMRNRLFHFPALDTKNLETRYKEYNGYLDNKTKQVIQEFFGFDGYKGFFSRFQVGRALGLSTEQVQLRLLEGIKTLELVAENS
jgi:DNA-directed RNA polymerase specialized sigma subunit